jgi:orotate phosphoribosyltransferase-like protein
MAIDSSILCRFWQKVSESDVKEMFAMREKGLTHREISERFNVSRPNVSYILNKKTWKQVSR